MRSRVAVAAKVIGAESVNGDQKDIRANRIRAIGRAAGGQQIAAESCTDASHQPLLQEAAPRKRPRSP